MRITFCLLCPYKESRPIFRLNWISDEMYYAINEKLFYITGMFFYINATINPIIYNVMSAKYRKAFRCIHQ